jgi:hypothetical protein
MNATAKPTPHDAKHVATRGGLNIPGTFEVHGHDGWVIATYTAAFFKNAEAHVDRLNAEDPDGGYTWKRVK